MRKYKGISRPLWVATGFAAAACVPLGTAFAQDATKGAQRDELTEVVITAERRAADVTHTPISMIATSGEDLAKANIVNISSLQTQTPSIQINNAGQYNSINIRGIGNGAVNPAITPGIAVQRDGLIQAETIMLAEPFWDIDHVEILRGPQGTFIGQSSTGGALLIVSKSPTFDGVNGYVNLLVGNYTNNMAEAAVNLPISDTWAMRVAAHWQNRGSYYFNAGSAKTVIKESPINDPGHVADQNVRVSLLWKPSDSFEALLKVENNHADTGGTPDQPNQNFYIDPVSGAQVRSPFYAFSTHQPFVLNNDFQARYSTEVSDRIGLDLKYTLPNGILLRSLTGFQHDDIRENPDGDNTSANALFNYHLIGPDNNYESEEVSIISPTTGRLSWIAGATWFYRNTPVRQNFHIFAPPYAAGQTEVQTQQLDIHAAQRTMGLYGQVSFQISDPWQLQVGVRQNWDNNFYAKDGSIKIFVPAAGPNPVAIVPLAGTFHDSVPTWKVGVNYQPTENQFFYGFVARGYKSGGVNSGTPPTINFDPEHLTDYELGWKTKMLDNHVQTEIGLFYIDFDGLQLPVTNPITGGGAVTNVTSSKIKGIEASIQAHLAGFNATAGISYNDTALGAVSLIASHRLPPTVNNNPQCNGSNAAVCFDYNPYKVNLSGGANPFSPKVSINADIDYGAVIGNATLRPRVTFSHTDKQFGSVFQSDNYFLMEARNLFGASVSYEVGPWTTTAFGTNLTDQTYVSAYQGNSVYYGPPREFGIKVSRTF
jgi:iron complex outermembrane recepter protein